MIWDSIWLMTILDIVIIGLVLTSLIILFLHRHKAQRVGLYWGLLLSQVGLFVVGLFYLSDLVLKHILLGFLPPDAARQITMELHIDGAWLVSIVAVSFWAAGLLYLLRSLIPRLLRYQDALKASREQHRLMVDFQSELIDQISPDGEVIFANKAYIDFSREVGTMPLDLNDIQGLNIFSEHTSINIPKSFRDSLESLTVENPVYRHETEFTLRDGRKRVILWRETALFDDDGKISSYLGVGRDVTDQKIAEAALQDSELKLRSVIDTVMDGIITINERGIVQSYNPAAARLFGYRSSEVIGQNVKLLMPEPYRSEHDAYLAKHIKTGKKRIIGIGREVVGLRKDGSEFSLELGISEFQLHGHRMFTGVVRDITERKQAEKKLLESELHYRVLFENIPVPVWEEDFSEVKSYLDKLRDGGVTDFRDYFKKHPESISHCASLVKILDVNQATVDLHNADCKADFFINLNDFFIDESFPVFAEELIALIEGKLNFTTEFIVQKLSGEKLNFILNLSVMPGCESTWSRVIIANFNITELKHAQVELKAAKDAAESIALQAQAANQAKSKFLSHMSHELRTPLSAIIGFSDLLLRQSFGPLNEKQTGYIKMIDESGSHLLSLIDDLLDLAKIDAGQVETNKKIFLPTDLLDAMVSLLGSQFRKKNLTVNLDTDSAIEVIWGDLRKCKQIMLNLLSNAIKYTPTKGSIEIRTEMVEGAAIRISVEDTGIGIRSEEIDKIFSEFHQADRARDEGFGGTGIGLALTKRLVELQGGEIGVESTLGIGSKFWFTLPLLKMKEPLTEGKK